VSVESANCIDVFGSITPDGERRYTKIYRVICSTNDDGPVVAQNAAGIERYGQAYSWGNEADLGAWAADISAAKEQRSESCRVWLVTVQFTSGGQKTGESIDPAGNLIENPLLRPVVWSGSYAQFVKAAARDRFGKPIVNTAGDLIEGLSEDDSRISLVARRNVSTLDLAKWARYRDKVNRDAIWGLTRRQIKVNNITWDSERSGPYRYFVVTYSFHINLGGWITRSENRGWRARSAAGVAPKKITDIVEPAYLDEDGVRLSQTRIDAGDWPAPIESEIEDEETFANLNLPSKIEA